MKTSKLVLVILLIVYYVGLGWFVYCDLTEYLFKHDDHEQDSDYFFTNFEFMKHSPLGGVIALSYYILTTLSTIGLGDLHPRSDYERVLMAFTMLSGVAIFSYVMGNFIDILNPEI